MKKLSKILFSLLLSSFMLFNTLGCNLFNPSDKQSESSNQATSGTSSDSSEENVEPDDIVNTIGKSTFYEYNNKYKAVDSYIMDDGNYYYFYYLGAIDFIPLNLSTAEGLYFNGSNMSLEFNFSSTNIEQEQRNLKNSIESNIELTTKTYIQTGITTNKKSSFEAKINTGIENQATHSISTTYEESYTMAVTKETTFEKNLKYTMSEDDPVGYYFYTSVASAKIYEVVVYNPEEKVVKFMSSYAQLGMALPGLFYSKFSFLDYGTFDISFDENLITSFDTPTVSVSNKVNISIDANGGECETTSLDGRIGETYGTLPTPNREGYTFAGWYCNNKEVNSESVIVSNDILIANWDIILSGEAEINQTINIDNLSNKIVGIQLEKLFDIETLKDEGYKMQITIEYSVKCSAMAIKGANYKIAFSSNGKNLIVFNNYIKETSYVSKREYSDYVSLTNFDGNLYFTPSTSNIFMVYISNIKMTFNFAK